MQCDKYRSVSVWRDECSGNLAVFCSDERFASATFGLLRRRLNIERCDLIVVAGGVAFIPQMEQLLIERLKLLVKAHKIKQVALISHEDCGYYKQRWLNNLKERQWDDLKETVHLLRQKGIQAKAFFAFVENAKVVFEELSV